MGVTDQLLMRAISRLGLTVRVLTRVEVDRRVIRKRLFANITLAVRRWRARPQWEKVASVNLFEAAILILH